MHYYKEMDYKEIAELLCVHVSTVYRVLDRYNEYGTVVPVLHKSGSMPLLGKPEEFSVIESLMAKPEIYLSELQHELFQNTGTWASISTLFRTIRRLGFSRKKLQQIVLRRSDSLRTG